MSDGLIHNDYELCRFGDRLTYKPDFKIIFEVQNYGRDICLILKTKGLDSETGEFQSLARMIAFTKELWPYPIEERVLLQVVRKYLGMWESHETDEWFRCDLKRVRNPHIVDT